MDALPVGTRLAEFEILALLGVGGFGMVYKAFDHSLHRTVAIKEYMPATLASRAADGALWARSSTDEPAFQAGLHSFVDEARMLAQFDHPSLVKVFRFWEAQNTAYMVMPLYHGMTLKQARTQMRKPPPEIWLRQMLWSVLSALRVLHDANTLHRDISPDNIFLQDFGPPVLLDLGASRHAINDRDRKHTAVLKVNYAPIEQYSDGEGEGTVELEQGPWSDLYSLGALVHGCLCNDTPLPATLRALRDRMVPFARVAKTVKKQFGEEYSSSFVNAISQALKLQPEERPQSIDAFLDLLAMSVPPAGIEHFDFRAELGEIWVEPTDQPDPAVGATTVDLTGQRPRVSLLSDVAAGKAAPDLHLDEHDEDEGPETVFLADERLPGRDKPERIAPAAPVQPLRPVQAAGAASAAALNGGGMNSVAGDASSVKPQQAAASEGSGRTRKFLLLASVAVLAVVGAAALGMRTTTAPEPAKASSAAGVPAASNEVIITELNTPASDSAAAIPDAGETAVDGDPNAAVLPEPAPAFVPSDDPRAVAAAAARARNKKVPVAPAFIQTTEILPVIEAPALPVARPAPTPAPAPAPRRSAPQRALCAETNVLTRSSCLRAECASPANRGLQACVEFRKAMEPLERNNFAN